MKRALSLAAVLGLACAGSAWAQTPSYLSEGRARTILMNFGCTNISVLSAGPEGTWHGTCSKGGSPQTVMVSKEGQASIGPAGHITEGHARSALMAYGCSNVSTLSRGPSGSWHGNCTKGGTVQTLSVAPDGTVSTAQAAYLTEAHARSALMQFGCTNISALNAGPDGSWMGMCSKGGKTSTVMVDQNGVASTQ